jgi:hypothetical protein
LKTKTKRAEETTMKIKSKVKAGISVTWTTGGIT